MDSRITVWADRLKERDPQIRSDAIRSLEALGDPDALVALGEVFATDDDPRVRALAQWAGKSIYYNVHKQQEATQGSSEEERRRAADILAKARAKKQKRR